MFYGAKIKVFDFSFPFLEKKTYFCKTKKLQAMDTPTTTKRQGKADPIPANKANNTEIPKGCVTVEEFMSQLRKEILSRYE